MRSQRKIAEIDLHLIAMEKCYLPPFLTNHKILNTKSFIFARFLCAKKIIFPMEKWIKCQPCWTIWSGRTSYALV